MKKKIWISFLTCLLLIVLAFAGACGTKLSFNEGYLDVIELGDPITLDEYIDPALTDDYTAILRCEETGDEFDLKMMGQWTTTYPGEFTLTYTVNSGEYKGSIVANLLVTVPEVEWAFTRMTMITRAGTSFNFNQMERDLNLSVSSYYDYTFFVKSVSVNGVSTDLTGQTDYVFPTEGTYTFTFGIRTEDGQELFADQKVTVRPEQVLGEGATEWMADNNISVHDYKYVGADGKVTLDAGYYMTSWLDDNVPYLAFNGDYGTDNYLMVDFTGKNLPQVSFFSPEVTSSLTDGKQGIYIHNGLTYSDGSYYSALDASRLTLFGPNKVSYVEFNNRGRFEGAIVGTEADPCPLSLHGLDDDCQYRYIVGFTGGTDTQVTIRILLINLTTLEREFDYTRTLTHVSSYGKVDFTDYFHGSIVLYGRYGKETVLDKVYAPITGISDITELDVAASFKNDYKVQYAMNSVAYVSDYINIPEGDYSFTVYDPEGKTVKIAEDGSFVYDKSGDYRLVFDSKKEGERASSISVSVMFDPTQEFEPDYFEKMGLIFAQNVRNGTGLVANTKEKYMEEGAQSIRYYSSIATTEGKGIVVGFSRKVLDFVFLERSINGFTFDVYSEVPMSYCLYDPDGAGNRVLMSEYSGTLAADTWTQFMITKEMYMANAKAYQGYNYALAISFYAETELPANSSIYIDNIQIVLATDYTQTISDEAQTWMDENNVEVYGYKSVNDDMEVQLYEGMYRGETHAFKNDDIPYLAFKGDYGEGTYVTVDFTGKNIPQVAFFVKSITPSITDGRAGVYVHTGMTLMDGVSYYSDTDAGRVTFLGPNKVQYNRIDADGRYSGQFGSAADPSPMSIRGLVDGTHYRYEIGIKVAMVGKVVLELTLTNLDTGAVAAHYEKVLEDKAFTEDYLSGSVVLYGQFGKMVTFDKVYPIDSRGLSPEAKVYLKQNSMSAAATKLDASLKAEMGAGTYSGADHKITNDSMPFIAYNGDYSVGSYVVVDFTGKNAPQMCFFVKEITNSLTDQKAGVYVHTGQIRQNGNFYSDTDCGRVTFLGPNKVEYQKFDADGRYTGQFGSAADPSPLSYRGLVDGTHYRYVAGIKSVETGKVTLELLLINLDTNTEVVKYAKDLTDAAFTADYTTGNIVMYGRYNIKTTLDKIYPIYTNVSNVYAIDAVSSVLGA